MGSRVTKLMRTKNPRLIADIESDPFGERTHAAAHRRIKVLGGRFDFESNSAELLQLVDTAYAGLPNHQFSATPPRFRIRLRLTPKAGVPISRRHPSKGGSRPPAISMIQGGGILGSATDSSTFAVLSPEKREALVSVSRSMLRFPYHVRYELIEFAVFTLASRAQRLVPLHAACIGLNGRGILLMGTTGAGKTTVALHCLLDGFDFLSEDSVFVEPKSMKATGVANFLHVRAESLRWLERSPQTLLIRRSPTIRRRSGVKKFELDLRNKQFLLAQKPLKVIAVAFLTPQRASGGPILRLMSKASATAKMLEMQGYGASLPQWRAFRENFSQLTLFEARRGRHPYETVEALRTILQS
jgi:hypothetical protein